MYYRNQSVQSRKPYGGRGRACVTNDIRCRWNARCLTCIVQNNVENITKQERQGDPWGTGHVKYSDFGAFKNRCREIMGNQELGTKDMCEEAPCYRRTTRGLWEIFTKGSLWEYSQRTFNRWRIDKRTITTTISYLFFERYLLLQYRDVFDILHLNCIALSGLMAGIVPAESPRGLPF